MKLQWVISYNHKTPLLQCKEILQEEEDLSEIVQLVGKVSLLDALLEDRN